MTLAEIIAAVRIEIGEPTEGYWRDTQLTRYINDGLRDLNDVARVIAVAPLNYAVGAHSAALPGDFHEAWVAQWSSGGTQQPLTNLQSGAIPDTTSRGIPSGYVATPAALHIWPVPFADGTVTLTYFRRIPALAVAGDTPIVEERWRTLLVYYAAGLAKLFAGEPEGPVFMSHYMAGKTQLAQERFAATTLSMNTPNILDTLEWAT